MDNIQAQVKQARHIGSISLHLTLLEKYYLTVSHLRIPSTNSATLVVTGRVLF
jgi:hypothetical protein